MTRPTDENHPVGPDEERLPDELVGALVEILAEVDPVPADVVAAARSSFAWHDIDAELASLVADSAVDSPLVLTRGPAAAGPRMLSFAAVGVDIEIEVAVLGDGSRRIQGIVVPGQPGRLRVHQRRGDLDAEVDAAGRFVVGGVAAGPACLRFTPAVGGPATLTETDWFPT